MQMMVIEDHIASYADPISIKAGDPIMLTGKTDEWDGHIWLWAVGLDGRVGWVPDAIVENRDGHERSNRDYSAVEMTCAKGETLIVIEETHGWAWCRSCLGNEGWVPLRNLSPRFA